MQLLSLRCTIFAIMLLVFGTVAEGKDDDLDTIKEILEQQLEAMTVPRNEAEIGLQDMEKQSGNQCDQQAIVGFTAELSQSQNYPALKTIVFDNVLENQGEGYNSKTGVFTAPYRGLYLFSVTVHSQTGQQVHLKLIKSGTYIGRVVAGNSNSSWGDSGSVSVITTLNKHDDVFVRAMFYAKIYGDQWSSFMGVLISRF